MTILTQFKALADETRLRLVNLLLHHELNVNEIVSLMDMGQSRISRHLKILTDCGILVSRRDGLMVFYRAAGEGAGREMLGAVQRFLESDENLSNDLRLLEKSLADRARQRTQFFDSLAPRWDSIKSTLMGDTLISQEVMKRIPSCEVAADLGCGTGELLSLLKMKAGKVIGVDRSPSMLDAARQRFSRDSGQVDLRIGEMEHLPLRDAEADLAVINMVLHHLPTPADGLREAYRVLKPGTPLIIVDLDKHENEDMRSTFGHRWLGFAALEMEEWMRNAGFAIDESIRFTVASGLRINLFRGTKR